MEEGKKAKRATGSVFTREQAEERARYLDAQAALPAGSGARLRRGGGAGGLRTAGVRSARCPGQRVARLEIDHELALRKGLSATAKDVAAGGEGSLGRREKKQVDRLFDDKLEQHVRDGGHEMPSSVRPQRSPIDAYLHDGRARAPAGESSVMRDAHEVAARRKRQLGGERRR